jgi:hypothetical protein
MKLIKVIHQKYSLLTGRFHKNFDDMGSKKERIELKSVFKFLSDFKISRQEFKDRDGIQAIIKYVNIKQHGNQSDIRHLNLEGFIQFLCQTGYFLYNQVTDVPATFTTMLLERLREVSHASSEPMFQKIFDAIMPSNSSGNDDTIAEM